MSPAMSLGAFSISLNVADLPRSLAFYEQLGFTQRGGELDQGWAILRNGTTTIGLFCGMFEGNILTFNPGWDGEAKALEDFEDVRALQARLETAGVELKERTDPEGTGPGHIILQDPDGNTIMFDQHVPKLGA